MLKVSDPESFMDVIERQTCQFIDGDIKEKTATFCPSPRIKGSVYCDHHHERCYAGLWKNAEKILDDIS